MTRKIPIFSTAKDTNTTYREKTNKYSGFKL